MSIAIKIEEALVPSDSHKFFSVYFLLCPVLLCLHLKLSEMNALIIKEGPDVKQLHQNLKDL